MPHNKNGKFPTVA